MMKKNWNFFTKPANVVKTSMLLLVFFAVTTYVHGQTTKEVTASTNSYTPSAKPYVKVTKIEAWGGGGGGGGARGYSVRGGGGGGGGYAVSNTEYNNATFNITVGGGGAGGHGNNESNNGANGGSTSVSVVGTSATITAGGGSGGGGVYSGAFSSNKLGTGGPGGAGTYTGGRGANGHADYSGGGGGAAGPNGTGGNTSARTGGAGAGSLAGNGGDGKDDGASGNNGSNYGGGGGGAYQSSLSLTSRNGGAGAQGAVRITYYAFDPGHIDHSSDVRVQGEEYSHAISAGTAASGEGVGNIHYRWLCNDNPLAGETGSSIIITPESCPFIEEPGVYRFVRQARGTKGFVDWCSTTEIFQLTVNCAEITVTDDEYLRGADSYTPLELDILSNDVNGIFANFSITTPPIHGTLNTIENGIITYTPETGYQGNDSFTYCLTNCGTSKYGTVTLHATSVELGCSEQISDTLYRFPNANFVGMASTLSISFSEDPADCEIILPTLPTGWESSASTDQHVAWFISMPENVTKTEIDTFLRNITYKIKAGAIKEISVVASGENSISRVYYLGSNDHYYQFIEFTDNEGHLTWYDCYERARKMTYLGRQGYLATLTSLQEDKFVTRLTQGVAWIGACRVRNGVREGLYYNKDSWRTEDDDVTDASDLPWYWACGPEIGQVLLSVGKVPEGEGDSTFYANQVDADGNKIYSNWNLKEPNNSGGEGFLTILKDKGTGWTGHTDNFGWNDRDDDANCKDTTASSYNNGYQPRGYLVEFGDKKTSNEEEDVFTFSVHSSGNIGEFNPGTIRGSSAVCLGGTASTITPTEEARGSEEPYLYKWYHNGVEIPGATAATYTPGSEFTDITGMHTFTREAKDGGSCMTDYMLSEGSYTLFVLEPISGLTSLEVNSPVCEGESITFTATGGAGASDAIVWSETGCPQTAYINDFHQFDYSLNQTQDASVNSSGNLELTSTGGDPMITMYNLGSFDPDTYKYFQIRYRVTSGTANEVEIFFTNAQYATAAADQRIYGNLISDGEWHTLTIDASTHSLWTHSNITGWRYDYCTNSGVTMEIDFIALTNAPASGNTYTMSNLSQGTHTVYANRLSSCNSDPCITKQVSTYPEFNPGTISTTGQTICEGGTANPIGISTSASGGDGNISYQWYVNDIAISEATSDSYTPSSTYTSVAGTYTFTRKAKDGSCSGWQTSNGSYKLIVNKAEVTLNDMSPVAICKGESTRLEATLNGTHTGSVSYQWTPATGLSPTTGYAVTANPTTTTTYTVTATANNNGCTAISTKTVTVTVNELPTLTVTPTDALCYGSNGKLTVNVDGSAPDYKIYMGGISGTLQTTLTAAGSHEISNLTPGNYTIAVEDGNGCQTTSAVQTINQPSALSLSSVTATAVKCNGGSDGAISYNVSGGTAGYTITITPAGQTTPVATITHNEAGSYDKTGLTAGTYTLSLTDANGCTIAAQTATVGEPALLTANIASQTNVGCYGDNSGKITVEASGGTAPYQYKIDGAFSSNNTFSNRPAGNYTITIKDNNGCEASVSTSITQPAGTLNASISQTNVSCKGGADGSVTILAQSGTAPYQYKLNDGSWQSSATFSDLSQNSYIATVKDTNGCEISLSVNITEPEQLAIVQQGGITAVRCKGESNGAFAFKVDGGTLNYTITIAGPAGNNVALAPSVSGVYTQTGLAAGTYTVSVTDAKECTAEAVFSISEPAKEMTVTITGTTQESCDGSDATATALADGGNKGYTYLWSDGQTTAQATELTTMEANSGDYTVTATDSKGCAATASVTITLNNPLAMEDITGPVVCTGTEFSITPENGTNGTILDGTTYFWPKPDSIPGIGGLAAGTNENRIHGILTNSSNEPKTINYTVTPQKGICIGNATGVSVVVSTQINPKVTIDMDNELTKCSNADNFLLTANFVNSNSSFTAVWKKDGDTIATHNGTAGNNSDSCEVDLVNDTCKGQYTYRVEYTDESGCTASDECIITVNSGGWSISQPAGDTLVECVSAAIPPAESLLPVVTDGCGRTTTRTLHSVVKTPSDISCEGTVVYTYRYTSCDETINDWTYTYTIHDVTKPTIAEDTITTKEANIDQTACEFSIPDLTADILAKASDNCTAADDLVISQNLAMGTVITAATNVVVTVTDKCGNSTTHTVNVTVPTLPTATIAPTHILCHGNTTGSATVTPANGTAPYTYLWSNGQTNATATDLDNTEYTVTVTDVNRCSTTASVTIMEPEEELAATTATVPVDCYGDSTGSATITVTGGTQDYSVTVNGVTKSGNSALTFENLPDGTYPVTIKDSNKCELTGVSVTITEPAALQLSITDTSSRCYDQADGYINYTFSGGTPDYTVSIPGKNNSHTAVGSGSFTDLADGSYTVTVTDDNGCSVSANATIEQINDTLTITAHSQTWTYDGNAHSAPSFDMTFGPQDFSDITSGSTIPLANGDEVYVTIDGSITNADTIVNNIANVTVQRDGKEVTCYYNIVKTNGELVVNQNSDALTLTCPIGTDITKMYDGAALAPPASVTGAIGSDVIAVEYSTDGTPWSATVPSIKDAGTQTIQVRATNPNYVTETCEYTLTVTPKPVTITADSATKVYDGMALTKNSYTNTDLASGDAIESVIVTGSQTVAGTSNNVPSAAVIKDGTEDVTSNYNITYTNGTLTVTPRPVTLTSASASKIYDGTPLTNSTVTVGGEGFVTGEGATYNVTGSQTNVGTSSNTFTYTLNSGTLADNYEITKTEGVLSVTQLSITVDITGKTGTSVYDGQLHTVTGYDVAISDTLYTESDFTFTPAEDATLVDGVIAAKRTDAGTTNMGLAPSQFTNNNANFNVTFNVEDGYQIIERALVTVTADNKQKNYGMPDPALTATITGLKGSDTESVINYTISRASGEALGDYTITVTGDTVQGNYNVTYVPGIFKIFGMPQDLTITSASDTIPYDGTLHTKPVYTVTFNGNLLTATNSEGTKFVMPITGDTLTIKPTFTGVTNVTDANNVDSNNTFTYVLENDAIYIGTRTVTYGTVKVTPITAEVTITGANNTADYDGNAHTVTGYTATTESTLYDVANVTFSGTATASRTYVGTTYMGLDSTQFTNTNDNFDTVTFNVTDGWQKITPKPLTITADSATKVYDGMALTKNSYTNTDLASGDAIESVIVTGSQTVAGTSNNVPSAAVVKDGTEDVTSNYNITYTNGTLTVTPRPVTLTSASASKIYDGTPLTNSTVTVGGDGFVAGEGATYDVTGTITNVGSCSNAFTYTLNSNTDANNYTITKIEGTLTILIDSVPPCIGCDSIAGVSCETIGNQTRTNDENQNYYTHSGTAWDVNATDNSSAIPVMTWSLTGVTTASGNSTLNGQRFNVGVTTVTWTATDVTGNPATCQFTVTVTDDEDPVIICPSDIAGIACITDVPAAYADYAAFQTAGGELTDNDVVDYESFALVDADTNGICPTTITRTYYIEDTTGNSATCTQVITIKDSIAPYIMPTVLDSTLTSTNCVFKIPDMREIVRNISTDCSEITVTQPSAGMVVYPMVAERDTTVNVIVTDICGNSSVKEVIITIPAKVTISAMATPAVICNGGTSQLSATAANVVGTAVYAWTPATELSSATIANPTVTLTASGASETVTYTVMVTDDNGCTATATTSVTVNPKVVMNDVADQAICHGSEMAAVNFTTPITDGSVVYNWSRNNDSISGLAMSGTGNIAAATLTNTTNTAQTTTITVIPVYTNNGNECTDDSITFTITVNPEVVMDTVEDWTLCVGETSPEYVYTSTITDGTVTYGWSNNTPAIGLAASGTGSLPSFVAANATSADLIAEVKVAPTYANNGISCQGDSINFHITVRPSIKTPGNVEFACPADTTVVLSYSECEQLVNIGEPEFENHMSGMNVNITNDAPEGNIFPEGTTIVTWTATDDCGAFLTCTQNVVVQFPSCGDSIADFDGYRYSSVRIGCQCWTGENARSEHYSDGTPVDNFRYYNDSDSLENIYGKLYSWYAAVRVPEGDDTAVPADSIDQLGRPYVQGVCPEGWALPTVDEYMLMIANSGNATHAKDGSNLHWLPGYEGQSPLSGFDAFGAGMYNEALARYEGLLGKTYFWTTLNVLGSETATTVEINYYCAEGLQTELSKGDGVSIRCIRKR